MRLLDDAGADAGPGHRAGGRPVCAKRSPPAAWSTCSEPGTAASPSRRCSRATARTPASIPSSSSRRRSTPRSSAPMANARRCSSSASRASPRSILSNFRLGPPDVMIVFSASGLSANPIEMAIGARRRGLPVIAVTSLAQSDAVTPTHSSGTRLHDHADVVIDLCTPAADALVTLDGLTTPVGPGSSIAAIAVVNEIKVQTAQRLLDRGAMPPVLTERVGRRRNRVGTPLRCRLRRTCPPAGARAVSRRARRSGRPRQAPGRGR